METITQEESKLPANSTFYENYNLGQGMPIPPFLQGIYEWTISLNHKQERIANHALQGRADLDKDGPEHTLKMDAIVELTMQARRELYSLVAIILPNLSFRQMEKAADHEMENFGSLTTARVESIVRKRHGNLDRIPSDTEHAVHTGEERGE